MQQKPVLPLSAITTALGEAIDMYFDGRVITIKAEITDVKKYPHKKWCFLKFLEKNGATIQTELKGVFWHTGYGSIAKFEHQTGQKFTNGLEVICDVIVRYHPKFGLSLEVLDLDTAHTIGKLELERQRTIDRLIGESPFVRLLDDEIHTFNRSLSLPSVVKKILLIAPPDSDGMRDFIQEINNNTYGYTFEVKVLPTQVQGDAAIKELLKALRVAKSLSDTYHALALVRGGGSNTDFNPFDQYDVCEAIASFPLPVFTGIGHDRNTSIADMMASQLKTPTKVANHFVEHNLQFEEKIDTLYHRLMMLVNNKLSGFREQLKYIDRSLEQMHPQRVLNRGYAILKKNGAIVEDVAMLEADEAIEIQTKQHIITATINKIVEI